MNWQASVYDDDMGDVHHPHHLWCYITGFPLSYDIEITGRFKDFQGPSNFIFKAQFSTEVYSMSSRTAIFNVYVCDNGTVITQ